MSRARSRASARVSVQLSERDLDIFEWLLDMKFSDIQILNDVFFDKDSNNFGGARSRISRLVGAGFLKKHVGVGGGSRVYYFASKKAEKALNDKRPEVLVPKALTKLRAETFEHDLTVAKLRSRLEELGRARGWESARVGRKTLILLNQNLPREMIPDAIYQNKIGKKVAFEYELSRKSQRRYEQKVDEFVSIMRSSEPLFEYCLFVASSEIVETSLKSLTEPFGTHFRVQRVEELIGGIDE